MDPSWFEENAGRFSGSLLFKEPLARHTYYRIGGPASVFAIPTSAEDLGLIAEGVRRARAPLFVMGAGSNLLASDDGFDGVIVKATRLNLEINATALPGGLRVRTGGSVAISTLLRRAAQEGWQGLEMLTGIPGSVGGAVAMNAGTHLGESKDALVRVEAIRDSERLTYEGGALRFEYRNNRFLPAGAVVWAAEWQVRVADPAKIKALIDDTLARRKATQPLDAPSCGSVFKNPRSSGLFAWQVIDQLGLRGYRAGGAQFSEKHSNFIVNLGQAKAADVRALITLAQTRAQRELGIALEPEVMFLSQP